MVLCSQLHASPRAHEGLSRCWSYTGSILRSGGIAADEVAVFLVDEDNTVKSLDRTHGSVIWTAELGGTVHSPILATKSSILVLTKTVSNGSNSASFYVRAVSKATGITQWVAPLKRSERYSLRHVDGSVLIIEDGSMITAMDVDNGQTRWSRSGGVIGDAHVGGGDESVAVATSQGKVELLSLIDGEPLDRFERAFRPTAFASKAGQAVVLGDARGVIEARHSGTRSWKYRTGGAVSRLIIVSDQVLAASNDNFVYSISLRSGDISWKRKLPGRISSVDLLGSGRAGVTVVGENTAYLIDIADGRFIEQLTLEIDDQFVGHPLRGDHAFLAALTTRGLTTFSTNCANEKAAVKPAAL